MIIAELPQSIKQEFPECPDELIPYVEGENEGIIAEAIEKWENWDEYNCGNDELDNLFHWFLKHVDSDIHNALAMSVSYKGFDLAKIGQEFYETFHGVVPDGLTGHVDWAGYGTDIAGDYYHNVGNHYYEIH